MKTKFKVGDMVVFDEENIGIVFLPNKYSDFNKIKVFWCIRKGKHALTGAPSFQDNFGYYIEEQLRHL